MEEARSTSHLSPIKRAGSSHRKLSLKMKRKLRRGKKKARNQGLTLLHFQDRRPDPVVAEEAAREGVSRAVWVERKSRDQTLHQERSPRTEPQLVFSSLLRTQTLYEEGLYQAAMDDQVAASCWYYGVSGV